MRHENSLRQKWKLVQLNYEQCVIQILVHVCGECVRCTHVEAIDEVRDLPLEFTTLFLRQCLSLYSELIFGWRSSWLRLPILGYEHTLLCLTSCVGAGNLNVGPQAYTIALYSRIISLALLEALEPFNKARQKQKQTKHGLDYYRIPQSNSNGQRQPRVSQGSSTCRP